MKRMIRNGVTLIELPVVISILTILFALLIPGIRLLTDDHRTYSASNMIASAISRTSAASLGFSTPNIEGAMTRDLVSGRCLILERNPNFIDEEGNYFAATRIKQGRLTYKLFTDGGSFSEQTEISFIPTNLWASFEPPITENMNPGDVVYWEGQETTIGEFMYSP